MNEQLTMKQKKENIIKVKTFEFAKHILDKTKLLEGKREFVLARQIMRSGTAPGALVRESEFAESKKDFIHKMYIALKEANETEYWLELIKHTKRIDPSHVDDIKNDCNEIIRILTSIVKTSKGIKN